jgi:hypothetical protein
VVTDIARAAVVQIALGLCKRSPCHALGGICPHGVWFRYLPCWRRLLASPTPRENSDGGARPFPAAWLTPLS